MKWVIGAAALAAAGVIGLAAAGFGGGALAQTPPEDNEQSRAERFTELLAQQLGVTVEELKAARNAAHDQMIDEAVAAGKITPERGEELKAMEPGDGRRGAIERHMKGDKIARAVVSAFRSAADVLGLTEEELRERVRGGENLLAIAQSQGIDEATFRADLTANLTAKINQAAADGDISQEVADRLLENLNEMVDRVVSAEGPFERPFQRFHKGPFNQN